MKTSYHIDRDRTAWTNLRFIMLALSVAVLLGNAGAADRRQTSTNTGDNNNACRVTAQLTLRSANAKANSDYWLDLARASTLSDPQQRKAAQQQAQTDLKENLASAKEQYQARLQLCGILDESRYDPVINPADFITPAEAAANPNPYMPLVPGTTFRYVGQTAEGVETNDVHITADTKQILGVTTRVVRDTVWRNGELVEDTMDWFAQDRLGNVWYFGELTLTYENGELAGIEGSWEAGKAGGKPGIIMKAHPEVGQVYRQEFSPGTVEDAARVLALNQSVTVPYGSFNNCLKTAEFTSVEPETLESPDQKFYVPGIGFVLEISGNGERSELVAIETNHVASPQ